MREKTLQLLITFPTTAGAMAMESRCAETGLPGRLISLPSEVSASCGLGWKAPLDAESALRALLDGEQLSYDTIYQLMLR